MARDSDRCLRRYHLVPMAASGRSIRGALGALQQPDSLAGRHDAPSARWDGENDLLGRRSARRLSVVRVVWSVFDDLNVAAATATKARSHSVHRASLAQDHREGALYRNQAPTD